MRKIERGPWHKIYVQSYLLLKSRQCCLGTELYMKPHDLLTNLEETLSINIDREQRRHQWRPE
jgi:hypothetical protein